jgi:hypothetical protein
MPLRFRKPDAWIARLDGRAQSARLFFLVRFAVLAPNGFRAGANVLRFSKVGDAKRILSAEAERTLEAIE